MDGRAQSDIKRIYSEYLNEPLIGDLITQLRAFYNRNPGEMQPIKTEGKGGRKLKHFSVFHVNHPRTPVLFAGAIEKSPNAEPRAVIRFDNRNAALRDLVVHTFLYRKRNQRSNRVNLIICKETLRALPRILDSQLAWFKTEYPGR